MQPFKNSSEISYYRTNLWILGLRLRASKSTARRGIAHPSPQKWRIRSIQMYKQSSWCPLQTPTTNLSHFDHHQETFCLTLEVSSNGPPVLSMQNYMSATHHHTSICSHSVYNHLSSFSDYNLVNNKLGHIMYCFVQIRMYWLHHCITRDTSKVLPYFWGCKKYRNFT